MRRALGGELDRAAGESRPPRPSPFRWLLVWLLLATVYFVLRLGIRWALGDAVGGMELVTAGFRGLDGRELAVVPAVQTFALTLLAELRRAVKDVPDETA